MQILALNASPRRTGTVATLLRAVADGAAERHDVAWVDVYDLNVHPCRACMKCRPDLDCVMPEDDGHRIAQRLRECDALLIGTPTYWGNMSGVLKVLFERSVSALMTLSKRGIPVPIRKGRPAVIVTACFTPWPLDRLARQSSGAIRAVREVLGSSGFRVTATVVRPGTYWHPDLPPKLVERARRVGERL